jgi:GT2 family glycosyltransferase
VQHPSIAIVILNWNGKRHLQQFLPSVVEHTRSAEIWLADNGSADDSVAFVRSAFPTVSILELGKNYGFAGGYNKALGMLSHEYFVLLNSDVEVSPCWVEPVLDLLKTDPSIAAAQPLLLDFNRKTHFEHAGAAGGYLDRDAFPFCAGRIFNSFEENNGQYAADREVFWASGAALFVRAAVYHECGGLDPDFFAHMEEIDLCWRMKDRGYKIVATGRSHVYHLGGGTLSKDNPRKSFLNFRNNLYLILKNDFRPWFLPRLVRRLALDGIAGLRFLSEGKPGFFLAVLRAHVSFFGHFFQTYAKRLANRKSLRNPNPTGLFRKSILFAYFLKKQQKFSDLNPRDFF